MATKYRRKVLTAAMIDALRQQAAERCEAWSGSLIECSGEADHVTPCQLTFRSEQIPHRTSITLHKEYLKNSYATLS